VGQPRGGAQALDGVVPSCRYISLSSEDSRPLYGREAEDLAAEWAAGGAEVVARDESHAVNVHRPDGRTATPAPGRVKAVDTTGAGDSFNAAYLSARLAGLPIETAVEQAHRLAATVVTCKGAIVPRRLYARARAGIGQFGRRIFKGLYSYCSVTIGKLSSWQKISLNWSRGRRKGRDPREDAMLVQARGSLGDLAHPRRDRMTVAFVTHLVAMATDVSPGDIAAIEAQGIAAVRARQIAIYLAHVSFHWPLARVAFAFGRDRTTCGYACTRSRTCARTPFDAQMAVLEGLPEAGAAWP
jgi:hypothetical protein